MAVCVVGALGYEVTWLLPDDVPGFWGVAWGWGPLTALGLAAVFGALVVAGRLPPRFRPPLVVPLLAAAAPILVVVGVVAVVLGSAGESAGASSEF